MTADTPTPLDQASESSTTRLIGAIMQKRPRLGALLRLTAVPLWFDTGLLAALRGKDDGQEDKILALLDQFSFVHPHDGRYRYSPEIRHLLLLRWRDERQGFDEAHRRALAHFEALLAGAPPANPVAFEELLQARLFHLLIVDEPAGLRLLRQLFRRARDEHRLAAAEQYVTTAAEQDPFLSSTAHAYLAYMHGLVDQMYRRWTASQDCFEALLARDDLPPDLVPLLQRALGQSLVDQNRWEAGIAMYHQALDAFQAAGDELEAALTAGRLGHAYLRLVLSVWGSGWLDRSPPPSRLRFLYDLGNLLSRLPLVLHLMLRLGFRTMLPVAHRIGYNMDWIIGRLLGTAAQWLRQAESRLLQVADPAGLIRVREDLAQLYRLLNHPRQAEALNAQILATEGLAAEDYRAVRARLGMAHALLLRYQPEQAHSLLEQVLPLFRGYGHWERVAQTQTLLARAHQLSGRPDEAVAWYRRALDTWQEVGDPANATDVVYEMEALHDRPGLAPESRQEILHAGEQVTRRQYPARYNHPLLTRFQRIASILAVVLSFLALRLSIHTESGTAISATPALIKPIHRAVPAEEELRPALMLTVDQQLQPTIETDVVVLTIVIAFAFYLAAYAGVGLSRIVTTSLDTVQAGAGRAVAIEPRGIVILSPEGETARLDWAEVTSLLVSDRVLRRRPLTTHSFTALFGTTTHVAWSAFTRHYGALQREVRARIGDAVPVYDLGANVLHSKSGRLFMLSLGYLVLFVILSRAAPGLLTSYLEPIPYNLSDLYSLAYLGVAFPLGWWLAVQPLRAHFLVSPRTPGVWWVGGAGAILAVCCLLQVAVWHLPLGRPDVVLSALALLLIGVAAWHVVRARERDPDGAWRPVYTPRVQALVGVLAALVAGLALASIVWELVSFHHLARGNLAWSKAERLTRQGEHSAAQPLYDDALAAYERSLAWREEAAIYNSRGAVQAQSGRYREAIRSYEKALQIEPGEWTYVSNIALAYTNLVSETESAILRVERYEKAIQKHDEAIAGMDADPRRYGGQRITARLLRAGAYYDLGQIYEEDVRPHDEDTSLGYYQRALEDYQWVIVHAPGQAAGYTGRGWALLKLRARARGNRDVERAYLADAIRDFEAARDRNPVEISALTGLGWGHYYLGMSYPDCTQGPDDLAGAAQREEHLGSAVGAYGAVIALERKAAIHYRVRAQFHWLLRHCDGHTLQEQLERSRDDYDRALSLEPGKAIWYSRRAHLYYALATLVYRGDAAAVAAARQQSLADFKAAATLEPENLESWTKLANVAYEWRDHATAIPAYERIVQLEPENGRIFWRLGWARYMIDDYPPSVEASARAIELLPLESMVYFNQGLAYLALGDLKAALQSYLGGVQAAEQIEDEGKREGKYGVGIADLRAARADPEGAVPAFLRLMEAGREGKLREFVCQVVYRQGLEVCAGPGTACVPLVTVLGPDTPLTPLARSPDAAWLAIRVQETGIEGWVAAGPAYISCQIDLADVPVEGSLQP